MAKPEIGARIVLDGAEEYQRSLKEVANAQKDLNKEMKLAESEFKATGDAQKLYNDKIRILNQQLDNQKKKLETAQKALKELSDKGVDKNSDLWRKWNNTLLDAQTRMNNLQADINTATAAMEDMSNATEQATDATDRAAQSTADYSETLRSIDKGVKFQNILTGLRTVKDTIGSVISTAYNMAKALVMSQLSGGDWAREIMVEAARAGVSVEEYQAQLYAQAVGGIDTDAVTEGVKKTAENLASTDAELLKLYNDLGISTRNADGSVRNMTETFWDSVDALKSVEDETTRAIYAQKLLGDEYMNLRGLVDLGSEGYEKLIEEGKQSAVVTEESVNALADMDAAVEKVNATVEATKHNIEAQLTPGFTAVAEAFSSILNDFNEFLQSEEGQAVFAKWNEELTGIAEAVQGADLAGIFTKAADTINVFTDALKWLTNNGENVTTWLAAIGGGLAALKIGEDVLLLVTLINSLRSSSASRNAALPIQDIIEDVQEVLNTEIPQLSREYDEEGNLVAVNGKSVGPSHTLPEIEPAAIQATSDALNRHMQERDKMMGEQLVKTLEEMRTRTDYDQIAKDLQAFMESENYKTFFASEDLQKYANAIINDILTNGTPNAWELGANIFNMQRIIEETIKQLETAGASGGGGAMNAMNAAIEEGAAGTKEALKSSVSAAFKGIDSVFAAMGRVHGAAYANAIAAQISRVNAMLALSPTAYGGTYYNPSSTAYPAYAGGTLNASIYVGKEQFGSITTPIVNARMGAQLAEIR